MGGVDHPRGGFHRQIREDLEAYTGRRIAELEAVPDPRVVDVWAVRVTRRGEEPIAFIWRFLGPDAEPEDRLEEVEFTSWPPTSH